MNLQSLSMLLREHAGRHLSLRLPDGDAIAPHFHVTEVGLVTKRFIDCGGTVRESSSCLLQVWRGPDLDHRLSAGRLASILDMARAVVPREDLEVEVEHEGCALSQYVIAGSGIAGDALELVLGGKQADCLAKEACGVGDAACCSGGC